MKIFINMAIIPGAHYCINISTAYLVILLFVLPFSTTSQAKKRCKPLLEKLHSIQAMQRNGYSLKRGQSLRVKEDKARDKWWQCEHSSLAKFKEKNGSKRKNKSKAKLAKSNGKKNKKKSSTYEPQKLVSFNQSSPIVISSKYQGSKNQAWLLFYQQPTKCQRPKSLNEFAFCNEDKRQQQSVFEQSYLP